MDFITEQKPSIKLMKMSKGYQWEIKIISHDVEELKRIDEEMRQNWGSNETN